MVNAQHAPSFLPFLARRRPFLAQSRRIQVKPDSSLQKTGDHGLMRAGKQLFLVGIALLVLSQAAAARPWLSRTSLADSNLSSLQEQLRQNQLRRLTTLDDESEYEVGRSSNACWSCVWGQGPLLFQGASFLWRHLQTGALRCQQ